VFAGCSKDGGIDVISLEVSEKTLYYGDKYQIEAISKATIVYSVENEYHAEVSETGLVSARFIGETNILLSNGENSQTFKVIVKPKYDLYPEPDVSFGDSKSSLIAKFGAPDSETSEGIGYANYSNAAPILMFLFDSSDRMTSYAVTLNFTHLSALVDFLSERYCLLLSTVSDPNPIFINGLNLNTATMLIRLQFDYYTSYCQVVYMPNLSD
jgi:hypothetical protein